MAAATRRRTLPMSAPDPLAAPLLAGDRRALARAITLVESRRPADRGRAEALLGQLLPATGRALRLGISGPPGAGKSTFIEALGQQVLAAGRTIAVLAVDPSSLRSGGSILGDKTRMQQLAQASGAYVRPSPAGGTAGGLARRSREAALLCEAAGFDVVVLETVGVGQSETAVAEMVDCFLLLLAPGAGDELQGLKRGIVELADLVVISKADGDLAPAAERARADYQAALHLLRPATPAWTPAVLACSALAGTGIAEAWAVIQRQHAALAAAGELAARRARQAAAWLWSEVQAALLDQLQADPATRAKLAALEREVRAGRLLPPTAARAVVGVAAHPTD
jgi:LAO/AO transport system kinase